MSSERIEPGDAEVLQRRAAQLARAPRPAAADREEVLAFGVGEQACVLELRWVREVQALRELLPTPMGPRLFLGLAPWRGRMLPVLDLPALLALPGGASSGAGRLLVLGPRGGELALAVTEVHGLQWLAPGEVERRSQPLDSLRPEIVRGITADGHLLLDAERLLALHRHPAPCSSPSDPA